MPSLCLPFHDQISTLRVAGKNASEISRNIGVDVQSVRAYIKKVEGVSSLSRVEDIDEHYFDVIDSHEKAYFLGFIAGDGAIVGPTLTITLHRKDSYVLDAFAKALGFKNRSVYDLATGRNQCRFTVSRKPIIAALAKYGIGPRKSLTMSNFLENIPSQYAPSACLGYFDADGSITFSSTLNRKGFPVRQYIQIRCTHAVGIGICTTIGFENYSVSEFDSIPNYVIGSKKDILKFYRQCYGKSSVFLTRKHDRFLNLIAQDQTISSSSETSEELGARVPIIA